MKECQGIFDRKTENTSICQIYKCKRTNEAYLCQTNYTPYRQLALVNITETNYSPPSAHLYSGK